MRIALWCLAGSSLIILSFMSACNENEGFKGATATGTAKVPDAENSDPEITEPPETPPVVPEVTPVETPIEPEEETTNVFKDCTTSASSNFIADLYQLPENTQKLPDFSTLTAIKKICLKQLDIVDRQFTQGFPGVESLFQWFALNVDFNLKITTAGVYKFRIVSDDGSKVFVDGVQLIDNDTLHAARAAEKTVTLTAGSHKVNVRYFQGPADRMALELYWTPPGGAESYIPPELVSR